MSASEFTIVLLSGAALAAVPLLLAALGELVSEQAGVLNIGLEGMMLAGAYVGFTVANATGSSAAAYIAAAACGAIVAAFVALFCVRLGANQIVIGIAVLLLAEGVTSLLHAVQYGSSYPRLGAPAEIGIPLLDRIPVVGPSLFRQPLIAYLAVIAVPLVALLLRRTGLGLRVRAAGWRPGALHAAGGRVLLVRTAAVLFTGAMAGLGGAYLSIVGAGVFVPFMTGGTGFIAIVIAMLSRGRPLLALLGAAVFGLALSLSTSLQLVGVKIPTDLVQMLPFLTVLAVLVVFARASYLPAALGVPFEPER
jgi:general nucleoside transport system permease protein